MTYLDSTQEETSSDFAKVVLLIVQLELLNILKYQTIFIVIVVTFNVQIKILVMTTESSGTCMYCSSDNLQCFSIFFNALKTFISFT